MTDPDDLIDTVSLRQDILRALLDAPMERRVLVDHLDGSKSTVYRGVSQLRERGLIESTAEGLRPTQFGVVVLERYEELVRTADFGALLADLPPGTIDPSALVGAEAVVPDNRSLDRHFARVEQTLRNADSVCGFSPAASAEHVSILRERVVNDGLIVEMVLTRELVNHLHRAHTTEFDDILSAETAEIYQTAEEMAIALLLVSSGEDTTVHIDLGEDGVATGLIINDTTDSRQWARAAFERRKQVAELVTGNERRSR